MWVWSFVGNPSFVFQLFGARLDEGLKFSHHLAVGCATCGFEPRMHRCRQIEAQALGWLFLDRLETLRGDRFCVMARTISLKSQDLIIRGLLRPRSRCECLLRHDALSLSLGVQSLGMLYCAEPIRISSGPSSCSRQTRPSVQSLLPKPECLHPQPCL